MSLAAMTSSAVPPDDRWNPYEALAVDHRDIRCSFDHQLPESVLGLTKDHRIWVCKSLNRVQRELTVAHELVHIERGIFLKDPDERAAEERTVETITAQRMIPWRSLVSTVFSDPLGGIATWARQLRVDEQNLQVRLLTLTDSERVTLEGVRGSSLPEVAFGNATRRDIWAGAR